MKITEKAVVALSYQLEVEGQIVDQASAEKPLEYIQGMHMLIPRFEEEVVGKEVGDSFEFTLSPAEGYGEYREGLIVKLPISAFPEDEELRAQLLRVGALIPLMGPDGQVVQGFLTAIRDEDVDIDLNHPMAGKTLHFTGTVVAVREATEKELTEGLHGEFLPNEGCHCGKKGGCHGGNGDGECCCGGEGDGDCGCEGGCNCAS